MTDIFKPRESQLAKVERGLRQIENEIGEEAYGVVHSALKFAEIDPAQPEIPGAWLDELNGLSGEQLEDEMAKLQTRFRVAKAAWMSAKTAPVGIMVAKSVMVGIMKARAMEGSGQKTLNVNVVSITAPPPVFEEKEIEHE